MILHRQSYIDNFRIVIASVPDRDNCVWKFFTSMRNGLKFPKKVKPL